MRDIDKVRLNIARTAQLDKLKAALPREDKTSSAVSQVAVNRGTNNKSHRS